MKTARIDFKFQECCGDHCRDWRETRNGTLPASNHSPGCPNYKTDKFYQVKIKGCKGTSCIVETQTEVDDMFADEENEYDVSEIEMTRDQYERLDEFDGF